MCAGNDMGLDITVIYLVHSFFASLDWLGFDTKADAKGIRTSVQLRVAGSFGRNAVLACHDLACVGEAGF